MNKVTWGIVSTAKIGLEKVIPAIQKAENCTVKAISSRNAPKAEKAAQKLNIPLSYASYDKLLDNSSIDVIYNPLPNHLHVPKTIEALQAGKHVLCEKPIALDANAAQKLWETSQQYPNQKVMEAFMYRFHPQWQKTKSLVGSGAIGQLKTVESFFSYFNDDPDNIRNNPATGGGGLMDIGCYCISLSRYLFDSEPKNVYGTWKIDDNFGTDYLASGVMDFELGTATFSCATQAAPYQRVNIIGRDGRIEIEIPFNAPPQKKTRIWHYNNGKKNEISFQPVDQYTLQAEAFADAIINNKPVPTPLEDAVANMAVIDSFRQQARK